MQFKSAANIELWRAQMLKCQDLIREKLADREEEFKELLANPDSDDYFDDPTLGIVEQELTTFTLSWGGPADYIEVVHVGPDIEYVKYTYSDWFDTASVSVPEESPLYKYAQFQIESLNERIG